MTYFQFRSSFTALLLIGLIGCQSAAPDTTTAAGTADTSPAAQADNTERDQVQVTRSRKGVVVSNAPVASRIGAHILAQGGNAVDAAVATAFALAVAWPEAGNLGGGGFMIIAPPHGAAPIALDFRETAPLAATIDMYTPGENRHHARHVGVPGSVAGLAAAHERFGKLPWSEVVAPAVKIAETGVRVDEHLAGSINRVLSRLKNDDDAQVAELRRVYGHPRGAWEPGDRLVLPDLSRTLQLIADGGAEAFYTGSFARRFSHTMHNAGGLITAEDLANYEAKFRTPTHARYRGHDVYGMPPPSSGGVCVALMLQILEPHRLNEHPRDGPRNLHLITEAMRRAFHQRALHLGDPDFIDVDIEKLTDAQYARQLGEAIEPDRATPSDQLQPHIPITEESPSTTHFSVIDRHGMAVACTTTLEQSWGSRVILPGTGFVLNNEMGDFNWTPGRTTPTGAIGTPPNVIEPGKRMLSSMSPTLVMRDGRPVLITGSPGGRTIINTVLGIVLNVLEFDMPVDAAVQAPRFHHQWLPDVLRLESGEDREATRTLARELSQMGHTVQVRGGGTQGSAHTIGVDPDTGEAIGVADYRRGGAAAAPR